MNPAAATSPMIETLVQLLGEGAVLPRPEARLVSLGTGRAGRLGTRAEAAAARGVRSVGSHFCFEAKASAIIHPHTGSA